MRKVRFPMLTSNDCLPQMNRAAWLLIVALMFANVLGQNGDCRASGDREVYKRVTSIRGVSWAPDGTKFVFASDRNYEEKACYLWLVDVNGHGLTQITLPSSNEDGSVTHFRDANPQWSPDGEWIAFDSDRGETRRDNPKERLDQVFKIDQGGRRLKQISSGGGWFRNKRPAWSPDGKFLAWMTNRNGGADIMLATAEGHEIRYLAVSNGLAEDFPSWSHDGTLILFTANREATRDPSTDEDRSLGISD